MTGISWLNETSNTLRSSLTDRQHPILIKCLAGVRCRSRFPEFPSKSHQSKAIEAHNNLVIEPVAIGWYVGPQIATQIHDSQRHLLALWCLNLILTTNALPHRVGLKRTLIERLKSYRTVYTHTNLKRSEPDGGGGNRWEMQSAGDESVRKEVAKLNLQRFEAHFGWQMRKTGTRNLPRPAEWKLMISAS